jgi:uncharacterized protein YbcV (DUF1398 family)
VPTKLIPCGKPVKLDDLAAFVDDLKRRGIAYKIYWPDDAKEPIIEIGAEHESATMHVNET